jgi:hypothetical protein
MTSHEKSCVVMWIPVDKSKVEIVFNKSDIDKFISTEPSIWKTEEERIHLIYSDRAKLVLNNLDVKKSPSGCYVTTEVSRESVYFAVYFLEVGKAELFNQDREQMKFIFKSTTEHGGYGLYDENKNIFYINPPNTP